MVFEFLAVPGLILAIVAVVFIVLALFLVSVAKKLLYNTVLGLLALFVINWLGRDYGFSIGINLLTVAVTAILGLAGVGLLIILHLAGLKV